MFTFISLSAIQNMISFHIFQFVSSNVVNLGAHNLRLEEIFLFATCSCVPKLIAVKFEPMVACFLETKCSSVTFFFAKKVLTG